MSVYVVMDREGSTYDETEWPIDRFRELVDQLDDSDGEHCDVAVTHRNSGWSLTCTARGDVILSKLRVGQKGRAEVTRDEMVRLMTAFAQQGPSGIDSDSFG